MDSGDRSGPLGSDPHRPDQVLRHRGGETALFVGADAMERSAPPLRAWAEGRRVFVITSPGVVEVQQRLLESIDALSESTVRLLVPDGEGAKTLSCAEDLWTALLAGGGTRDSRVVGVGGGSVSDVAGFVSATFLRGVELALVPTTLLAQVDAAIGGKTAIDLPGAKNSVGAFWHPALVVADTRALDSLDASEWRSGMVEVIKIAAAANPALFESLEAHLEGLVSANGGDGESERLDGIIGEAIATKVRIVERDPSEGGPRQVLNLGHTLGHAIETTLGYRRLRHGEAVAYGLLFALRLAVSRGGDEAFARRCAALLARLTPPALPELDTERIVAALGHDKKARRDGLRWILPMALGRVEIATLAPESLEADIASFLADPWHGFAPRDP